MDFEGEADAEDFDDYYYDEFDIEAGYDDVDGDGSWVEDGTQTEEFFFVGVARVPLFLLQGIAELVQGHETLYRAWMLALTEKFPDTSVRKLRSDCPSLLPPWLLRGFATYQDVLVLRHGGIFTRSLDAHGRRAVPFHPGCKVGPESHSLLAATSQCRFHKGFSSEGMLCNNPPIPLRVLDFLEHTEDLLNLALVCKATHQAGHVLRHREFPGGVGPGLLTEGDLGEAMKRRKRSMMESALRQPHHPVTGSMASASTMAAETEPEACAGAGTEPQSCAGGVREPQACAGAVKEPEACAGAVTEPQVCAGGVTEHQACPGAVMEAQACAGAVRDPEACAGAVTEPQGCADEDAEEADQVYQKMYMSAELDAHLWDVLDWCMLTLLYANKCATDASVRGVHHPSLRWLLLDEGEGDGEDVGIVDEWRMALSGELEDGIVMDTEAVSRAVAHWAELNITNSGGTASEAEHVMRVLRAAERHGQGVIVHPGCRLEA